MQDIPFRNSDLAYAETLLDEGKVRNIVFSEGTYQTEVADPKLKAIFWPFLQLNDEGKILDRFCTCKTAEKNNTCPHLAAAFLKIFNNRSEPLHVRFRESLWNQLCQIASRRHGYDVDAIKKGASEFVAGSVTGKRLFFLRPLKEEGRKRIDEILFHRSEETEETSLKFSNLPAEELALWREKRPSHNLSYELSFWSDLAKWWMQLQEKKKPYKITFAFEKKTSEKVPLPKWILVHFPEAEFGFYISDANWPQIIPSLTTVSSSLPVNEYSDQVIQKITYDPESKSLMIDFGPIPAKKGKEINIEGAKERQVGDWIYVSMKGFYLKSLDPIFREKIIPPEKIAYVLQRHPKFMERYLTGTSLHRGGVKAQYQLFFDEDQSLHIQCYVFKPGDLQYPESASFGPWVYLKSKGFYLLENRLFDGIEKVIPKDKVSSFVNNHRHLLQSFEGFQTYLSTLESQLVFSLSKEGILRFDVHFEIQEELGEIIDLEDWMYVKGRGFYLKASGRNGTAIRPGLVVLPSDISSFINSHKEELEHVKGFFASRSPIEKMGLNLFLNERKQIVVKPEFFLLPEYKQIQVRIFGDYAYVEKEGFSEVPIGFRLPPPFTEEKTISPSSEPYFVAYELETLQKSVLSIDPRLRKPAYLRLAINQIKKDRKTRTGEWIVDLSYQTDIGTVDVFDIWRALHENKRHLFSNAGLILLRDIRFNWLKSIAKRRWLKQGKQIRLNTLEWLKLSMFEEIIEPRGDSKAAIESRRLLDELKYFQAAEALDLSGLKSSLRPYQEIGVRWLWFLYCRGLSGLLCDEMGLGKTHQAMALLAAAKNLDPLPSQNERKYLVVCPTSVIYHWEGLLKKFLPQMKVTVFYGIQRSLERFQKESNLLLTSYGTLRSEKKAIDKIDFEIAIFDEIQIAKNIHSQTHKTLRALSAKMRLGLTGTPIENRLLELKALFDVVLPNYLPAEAAFREYFVNPIEKNQDQEKKGLLSRLIKPFILRRKKTEVLLELPEKTEEIAYCDLSEEQQHLYRKALLTKRQELLQELKDESKPAPYVHVFALFSTLKQICDHPCLISKKYTEYAKHHSGKWELFIELLEEARESGQKLVVFSQYLGMLDIIEAYLKEKEIGFAGIRGSTQNRKAQLERFRDDPQCEVFVGSLQAAGVGIDLVAASVVIHYDRWWNPAKENQATDRVHRIGQSRGVQVFKMVTKNTIEEHIHRMIEKKMGLMEGVVGFDEHDRVKGLDREELIELLQMVQV